MRLLHTSDWHLGRSLHRADLAAAQATVLDHLVETVRVEQVDVVLVAGDVYDRALPPVEAVHLCGDAMRRLRAAGARVVLISGNHDSATRLGFGADLIDAAGVHLRTRVSAVAEPVLMEDGHGPVAIYAVPYLEPAAVCAELPGDPQARGHAGALGRALDAARADLTGRGDLRSVVLAHGWVTGGAPCESERDISVGGVGAVPAALFDGFDYAALGHLHGPQVLGERLRYSGSPLAYSFSEAEQVKGSWLLELGGTGLDRVDFVPAPTGRALRRLRGTLADLLTDPAHAVAEQAFVSATLTDPVRPQAAGERLRARFPHLLVLEWDPPAGAADGRDYRERVRGRSDMEVALAFVSHVRGAPATAGEQALLGTAFEAARVAGDAEGRPADAAESAA